MRHIMKQSRPAILIVDDDKDIRENLSAMLRSQGYDITSVASTKEASEKMATQFFDVALLDVKLPDIEGTQLLSDLKKVAPQTINILITGYPSLENATEALNFGAHLCLTKPLDPEKLLNAIRTKLEEHAEKERITRRKMVEWTQWHARKTRTSFQQSAEKVASKLTLFGLTRTQAKIYIGLMALGTASAAEIVALSSIRREEVYRALPELEKRGLITRRFGTPRKFSATKHGVALEILSKTRLEALENEISTLEQEKDEIVSELERIVPPADEEEPSVEALFQKDAVLARLVDMTRRAENQLVAVISSALPWQTLLGHVGESESNGRFEVSMRIITEKTDEAWTARLLKANTSAGKRLELRQVEELPFRMLMIDDKEAMWGEPYHEGENTQALWTNCQTHLVVLKMAFENLWQQPQSARKGFLEVAKSCTEMRAQSANYLLGDYK